jgi:alpha-tubulin suppressor-like RCC1 family protein
MRSEMQGRMRSSAGIVLLVMALAVVLGGFTSAASGTPPISTVPNNAPTITFSPPSPSEGATLTSNSVRFAFAYNRKPTQTRSLVCTLQGPTPSSGACETPVLVGPSLPNWSQSGKSYSGLANGSYTMNVQLFLSDGGMTLAVRRFTINQAPSPQPTRLKTQAVPQSIPVGGKGHDTATLEGANAGSAGGNVTYALYSDAACTQAVSGAGGQVTVSSGNVPDSAEFDFRNAGTFYWQASYSGDALNQPSLSVCNDAAETVTVSAPSPEATTLTTQAVPKTLRVGGQGHDTATLLGANAASAGGTVAYALYSDPSCTQVVPGAGGQVTVTGGSVPDSADFVFTSAGTYYWQASYSGDALNQPSTSACNESSETVTVLPAADVVALANGFYHSCALTNAGGVKCWGRNNNGQLGNGTNTNSNVPVAVVDGSGLLSGVIAITAGGFHTCALTSAGGVKCWGAGFGGELGNGVAGDSNVPTDVIDRSASPPLLRGVTAIAAGGYHTCVLKSGGEVECWGDNMHGALGEDPTIATRELEPVIVSGLPNNVSAIAAGVFHTCAITSAGAARCWGENTDGQLGNGSRTESHTPVPVTGFETGGAIAIAAGDGHSCALSTAGGVKCWGDNESGEIGDGSDPITVPRRLTPVDVVGFESGGASAIAAGSFDSCAVTTAGALKCWGDGGFGQLGNDDFTASNVPVSVIGFESGGATAIATNYHTCAIPSAGGVKCWGLGDRGELGNGANNSSGVPVDVLF